MYVRGVEPFNCVGGTFSSMCVPNRVSEPKDICGAFFNRRELQVETHVMVKTSWLYLVPLSYALAIAGYSRRCPLKREESVRAEHNLIFVAVVEDCLARAVVADLRPE